MSFVIFVIIVPLIDHGNEPTCQRDCPDSHPSHVLLRKLPHSSLKKIIALFSWQKIFTGIVFSECDIIAAIQHLLPTQFDIRSDGAKSIYAYGRVAR